MSIPPTFDPSQCKWGYLPTITKPYTERGDSGTYVGYLRGVLKCKSGQTQLTVNPPPGPWNFNWVLKEAVMDFQTFWGLTVDGEVGPQTWPLIDWASAGFPT